MALIETSLIWVTYAVALGVLLLVASVFVYTYQTPRERSAAVTIVSLVTLLSLLATVLLTPVDIALVSSTTDVKLGRKKEWASPDAVDDIIFQLKLVYYSLYTLDAVLCLLVVPFTYFWYEEYDEVAASDGQQSFGSRFWAAAKYTAAFVVVVIILFLVGFFVPVAASHKKSGRHHLDLDFFRGLLEENHGERALTFSIGLLITIGTVLYCIYTGPGLALLPLTLIKSAPRISAPNIAATTSSQLEQNRERQRQLEMRGEGRENGLDARDRRELESLVRDERTLTRRQRLAEEELGHDQHWSLRAWHKVAAVLRPLKLIGGLLLFVLVLVVWASMLITCIDKIKNSVCRSDCGYLLAHTKIFQPINWLMVRTSRLFPIDYIIFLFATLLFFAASVVGIASIGIRFLWVNLFRIRKGHTSPQALLMATVFLTLIVFAINYASAMILAPQYATYGAQTYCDRPSHAPDEQPDCSNHRNAIRLCRENPSGIDSSSASGNSNRDTNWQANSICTPTVVSTFLNRITLNFPFFGLVTFWAQFAFLGFFILVLVVMIFRTPKLDEEQLDADLQEEEEEGLLASTSRRFGASWQDITGRATGVKRQQQQQQQQLQQQYGTNASGGQE